MSPDRSDACTLQAYALDYLSDYLECRFRDLDHEFDVSDIVAFNWRKGQTVVICIPENSSRTKPDVHIHAPYTEVPREW